MRKSFHLLLLLIGIFMMLPATLAFAVPKVVLDRMACLENVYLFLRATKWGDTFYLKTVIKVCLSLLYVVGFAVVFYSDTLIPKGKESSKNRFAMVVLYFSVMIMAVARFLMYLQYGIAAGFTTELIVRLIVPFTFLLFVISGLKDEITIMRK